MCDWVRRVPPALTILLLVGLLTAPAAVAVGGAVDAAADGTGLPIDEALGQDGEPDDYYDKTDEPGTLGEASILPVVLLDLWCDMWSAIASVVS